MTLEVLQGNAGRGKAIGVEDSTIIMTRHGAGPLHAEMAGITDRLQNPSHQEFFWDKAPGGAAMILLSINDGVLPRLFRAELTTSGGLTEIPFVN
jgi:hypothetical protein